MTNRGSPTSETSKNCYGDRGDPQQIGQSKAATDLLHARSETRILDETLAGEGFNQPSTSRN